MVRAYRAGTDERIEIGFVTAASPEAAYAYLERTAQKLELDGYGELRLPGGAERRLLEYLLYRREDRLIDHGLARFGWDRSVIQRVVDRGGAAVRLAALRNPAGNVGLRQADAVLRAGTAAERKVLLENPGLSSRWLRMLFARSGPFADIDDDAMMGIVEAIYRNERLRRPHAARLTEPVTEIDYHAVPVAIWSLASTVPATQAWAGALWNLLSNALPPTDWRPDEETLGRWEIDEPRDGPADWFKRSASFYVRSHLVDGMRPDERLRDARDPALRMSYYRRYRFSDEAALDAALERDGSEFFHAALDNEWVWRFWREWLRTRAWKVPGCSDPIGRANEVKWRGDIWRERHPEWFVDAERDDLPPAVMTDSAKLAAIEALLRKVVDGLGSRDDAETERLGRIEAMLMEIRQQRRTWF